MKEKTQMRKSVLTASAAIAAAAFLGFGASAANAVAPAVNLVVAPATAGPVAQGSAVDLDITISAFNSGDVNGLFNGGEQFAHIDVTTADLPAGLTLAGEGLLLEGSGASKYITANVSGTVANDAVLGDHEVCFIVTAVGDNEEPTEVVIETVEPVCMTLTVSAGTFEGNDQVLAETGANVTGLGIAGAIALVGGAVALIAARRRTAAE
ncbi:MAG: LPXTG cell wall anchor domain-containing protein [Agromyces sp.]